MTMISYADTVAAPGRPSSESRSDSPKALEPDYGTILRTLETCPLGQEDDQRRLSRSIILGEN
jgi:hypothetical protein